MRFALSSLALSGLMLFGYCGSALPPCDAQNAAITPRTVHVGDYVGPPSSYGYVSDNFGHTVPLKAPPLHGDPADEIVYVSEVAEPTIEPVPAGEHSVSDEVTHHKPEITVPAVTPVGEPIEASVNFTPHEGVRSKVEWSSDCPFRPKPGPKPAIYLWAKPGVHSVSVTVIVVTETDIELHQQTKQFTVGDPPPPKPLADLVTKEQAASLALFYRAALSIMPQIETAANFYAVHGQRMATMELAGSEFESTVLAHFDAAIGPPPFDRVKLVVALEEVIKALGAPVAPPAPPPGPTVPPVDPNAPGVPVSFDGFQVLIVEESGERPLWLYSLVASPTLQAYLNSHCVGGRAGWRNWDQNETAENAPASFREMMALPRPNAPCIVVTANRRAHVIPLSKETTDAGLLAALKKYGGE